MSNTDAAFGLRPVAHMNGNPWNGMVRVYYHSASDGTAIFKGDLVQADGTNDETTGKYPAVKQHVLGQEDNVGVAVGFGTTPQLAARVDNLNAANYCPASTAMYIAVVDDPDVIFAIQEDSDGAALTAAAVYSYADVQVGSGSTTTGTSAMELDSSDAADSEGTLQILRLAPDEGNDIGNYAIWHVRINEHLYRFQNVVA